MGNSKQRTVNTQSSTNTQKTSFDQASDMERRIMAQYEGLGNQQNQFLGNLFTGNRSIYELEGRDQQQLDQAYQSAFDRFDVQGKDYADYLASTRGLNKSDTPVSQQAMERYGLGMSDLLSQRANAGLNLGMQSTMAKLGAVGATPGGLNAAFAPMYNERMAGGTTTMTGSGRSDQTTYQTPSVMSQIGQGMALGSQAIGLGAQLGGMFMGPMGGMSSMMGGAGGMGGMASFMPSMSKMGSGMGSGASANQWFG